jgi:Na+-driven multidrug efflux pump
VLGLFTARWVLEALGQVDFGLYGVVGGLTAFIAFFNGLLAAAVGRFYAVSIGASQRNAAEGLELCRQWFSIAVFIHTLIPIILMMIGYPIGEWAVRHWLTIPPDRIESCVWVFRFVCISCFIGMVNVPFQAMYTAKQYIAELTTYSFATTTLNFFFLYYMVSNPGDWLAKYAFWGMLISVVPQLIICIRAVIVFPECRFKLSYVWSAQKFKELLYYAGWQTFGGLGAMLRGQGIAVLVNKYFGPKVNSAMALGSNVVCHASTLSSSLIGAFQPAIANAYGAGDMDRMRALAYQACKIGTLLLLIFMIPIAVELPEILRIWLKNPPQYTDGLCWSVMAMVIIDKTSVGHMLAVNARGKIAVYQAFLGGALLLTLPIAWALVHYGWNVYAVGYSMVITMAMCAWGRVWFARRLVGLSARYWLLYIFLPLFVVATIAVSTGLLPRLFMNTSFVRVLVSGLLVETVLVALSWLILLNKEERNFVISKVKGLF